MLQMNSVFRLITTSILVILNALRKFELWEGLLSLRFYFRRIPCVLSNFNFPELLRGMQLMPYTQIGWRIIFHMYDLALVAKPG